MRNKRLAVRSRCGTRARSVGWNVRSNPSPRAGRRRRLSRPIRRRGTGAPPTEHHRSQRCEPPAHDGCCIWRAIRNELSVGVLFTQEINPWEHLNYLDNRSLKRLLTGEGFEVLSPTTTLDVGLREVPRSLRRISNAVRSASRAIRYGIARHVPGTLFHARVKA